MSDIKYEQWIEKLNKIIERIEELEKRLKGWEKTVINAIFTTHTHLRVHQKIDKEIAELEKNQEKANLNIDSNREQINANLEGIESFLKEIAEIKSVPKEVHGLFTQVPILNDEEIREIQEKYEEKLSGEKEGLRKEKEVKMRLNPSLTDSKPERLEVIDCWDHFDISDPKPESEDILFKICPKCNEPEGNKSYIDGWAEGYLVAEKQLTAEFIDDIQDMDRTYIDNDEALNKVIEKWEEELK